MKKFLTLMLAAIMLLSLASFANARCMKPCALNSLLPIPAST